MAAPKRYPENRERPNAIRVMTTDREKRALIRAAKKADQPLSVYVREAALEKARGMEAGG
jgi:hypothetical protein